MGAGRRALGPSHTSPSQHSVPQGENKLPKSYQGTKTPLTLLRQLHCSASSQTCSKCCTDFPSAKYINTNNRFSPLLPTAPGSDSTAQAHCTVSPHSAHGALGSIEFLFPLVSFFSVFFIFFFNFPFFFPAWTYAKFHACHGITIGCFSMLPWHELHYLGRLFVLPLIFPNLSIIVSCWTYSTCLMASEQDRRWPSKHGLRSHLEKWLAILQTSLSFCKSTDFCLHTKNRQRIKKN